MKLLQCCLIGVLGLVCFSSQGQAKLEHRAFLIGNFGDLNSQSPFYQQLLQQAKSDDAFSVVLLGDFFSESDPDLNLLRELATSIEQSAEGHLVILTGDRDWNNSGKGGWERIQGLEKTIDSWDYERLTWTIDDGCPGPKTYELSENLSLVAINTQWWNHPFEKPIPADAECKIITEKDFLNELKEVLEENSGRNLLVAGHFPLISYGPHGGYVPFKTYLSPPVVGSFVAAHKRFIGGPMSIVNKRYDHIRRKLLDLIQGSRPVVYASGHERNLQVISHEGSFLVNSGSPKQATYAKDGASNSLYSQAEQGFIELQYFNDGRVDYVTHSNGQSKRHSLFYSLCGELRSQDGAPNSAFMPCATATNAQGTNRELTQRDTVLQAGNYPAQGLKKLLFGSHHRSSWNEPTKVPFLDLENTHQGLRIYEKGGGRQSTSLKIKGGDGREYVFRSVDKDPTGVLPLELRGTIVADLLKDATSMQHPYGAMVVAELLNSTDILHATPDLHVLPNSNTEPFLQTYGGLFGMLEEKPTRAKNVKVPFAEADDVVQSYRMFRELYEDNDNEVDTEGYAKARMLDILVGDWGRHEDNWKWAEYDRGKSKFYRPIPRDRDHAFSRWDGALIWLLDREWAKESGENFGYTIRDIRSLTWPARHLDRFIAAEVSKEQWLEAARYLKSQLTDEVIANAVKKLPAESYALSGEELTTKLQARIKDLEEYALQFYLQQAREVDVVGSNKKEHFECVRNADGSVEVSAYPLKSAGEADKRFYYRRFIPGETREIRLFGLGGDDVFNITGSSNQSIKVVVVGGPGDDNITDQSAVKGASRKTRIVDRQENNLHLGKESKVITHWDPVHYNYNRTAFAYNRYFPLIIVGYNANDGLGLTGGVTLTRNKLGKEDFAEKHSFRARITTEEIRLFRYNGRFHHTFGKWDVTVGTLLANHNDFNFYYGLGNGTTKTDSLFNADYYRTRYDTYGVHVGLIRDFWKRSHFSAQIGYENNGEVIDANTILDDPNPAPNLITPQNANLVELRSQLLLDFRDRRAFPERGVSLDLQYRHGVLTDNEESYGIIKGSIQKLATFTKEKPITLGLTVGGSTSFNASNIPFYKLEYLGQLNGLRGFQENRFTGESLAYYNVQLRIELAKFRTSILPMKFGIGGFYDSGRIFSDFDITNKWHQGYGGGFYLIPLKENFAITASVGFSEEESGLLLLTIGSGF